MTIQSKSKLDYNIDSSIIDLSTVEPETIVWNWKPYLPQGKIVIIDGDGGVGKTSILLDIIARMTTGRKMPDDGEAQSGGAVYISFEDGIADTIVPRLKKMRADLTKIRVIKDVTTVDSDSEEDVRPFDLVEDYHY
jgi:DNA repair protein RadA/Sms